MRKLYIILVILLPGLLNAQTLNHDSDPLKVDGGLIKYKVPPTPATDNTYDAEGETDLDLNVFTSYNFTNATTGLQTESVADSYFNLRADSPNHGVGGDTYDTTCYVVDDGLGNKKWRGYQYNGTYGLITQIPASPMTGGGFLLYIDTELPSDSSEYYLSYNFRYQDGYNGSLGGKLPGIKSANDHTVNLQCDGFSLSLSFTGDSSEYYRPAAEGVAFYWSCANMADIDSSYSVFTCGVYDDEFNSRMWAWPVDLSAGGPPYIKVPYAHAEQWENLTIRIVLNSAPGTKNGIFEAFLNGLLVGRVTGLELDTGVDHQQTEIDVIKFTWFFGGNETKHAPIRTEWVEIDDMFGFTPGATYEYESGGSPVRGNNNSSYGTILDLPNGYRNEDGSWTKVQR